MTVDIIRKANRALMKGKELNSYNLPKNVTASIASKKYTREQINEAYAKALKMG